ncbi:MAG: iron ABC transporter permease [Candidatus Cloacimonetes bacterium]|nr:iron ABC transporter permease [Candidatus Cloacimonadota bacterium]
MKRHLWLIPLSLLMLIGISVLFLFYHASGSHIILQVRLPRLVLGIFSGIVLAVVGSSFQVILNNPLAEPYILGTSSGAALGSVLAMLSGVFWLMPLFGFAGALFSTLLVWFLARTGGFIHSTRLLLSGVIIGMFFSAIISLLIYLNQREIGSIIDILMGNLGRIFTHSEWRLFLILGGISSGLVVYLFFLGSRMNAVTAGDWVAHTMGADPVNLRKQVFVIGAILTGFAVAYAGVIGFIGLIIPHMIRLLGVNRQRQALPASAFGGAFLLVLCDFIAMHIAVIEIPVGVVTAFIGSPFFIYLLIKKR